MSDDQPMKAAQFFLNHGRRSTYINHNCRCDRCVAANNAYQRRFRERAAAGEVEPS